MFIIKLKKYIVNVYIFSIIISKIKYLKEISLIILYKINKNLKISFYYTILPFYLLICLRIKSAKEFFLILKK